MTRPLFPVAPASAALSPNVGFTRPSAPEVLPDLSFNFRYDLVQQIGNIRTDVVASPDVHPGTLRDWRVRRRREASIAQECYATLAVQRGFLRAFTRGYGIDYQRAMQRASFGLLRADIENQITDQLTRIPGVASVTNYVWERTFDRAHVTFLVRLSAGGSFPLSALIPPETVAA